MKTVESGSADVYQKLIAVVESAKLCETKMYQHHVQMVSKKRDSDIGVAKKLQEELAETLTQGKSAANELQTVEAKVKETQETLDDISPDLEFKLLEREKLGILLNELNQLALEEEIDVDHEMDRFTARKKHFQVESRLFHHNFGLEVHKLPVGNWKEFGFRWLSGVNTEVEAKFKIRCTKGLFEVDDIQPPLSTQDQLLDNLNQTGDFRSFLFSIRKEFEKAVTG